MSLTNKVLYDIDQRNDTTPTQKETARKNIGAYEDKTTAGGGTGIPKADLASDVQSSLGKADSSVQSVTSNGQALTKSAAGAIDIPKATDTKWGVVQVVNELKDNQNVIPNSRVIKEAVDGLSAALQARATFWTVQEWQTQSAQPGDASKIYYVGPKGTGNDQYDMYEWRTSTRSYVLTDESTISLDGYWHGAPDIVGEDTVAPFVTSIEKNADDTVKYRTCSATVGDLSLPVFMDSGVITSADPHFMYPTVNESTTFEEVEALVNAGYRPIFVPDVNSFGVHTRYILTGAIAKGYTPAFIFTALIPGSKYTRYFTSERMQTVICQNVNEGESEDTWVWNDEVLIPNIPEPNQNESDVGKVLTVGEYGELYWDEPAGGNNVEVKAGTDNLHVTSAVVNDKTIFTMSADNYREGQYIHIDENNVITASGLQPKLPTPTSSVYLCGSSNGNMYWYKRKKYMYNTDLNPYVSEEGVHTITQTDIDNKYCDIPITWSTETGSYGLLNVVYNFLFALTIDDMYLDKDGSNYPLNNIVSKIKCSLCDETRTWFSNDNAHGNDPHGMILDDILGSELARVPGYHTLDKVVRRVAHGQNNGAQFIGPSFRIMFSDTSTLAVGDKIVMDGRISGIDFRNGGWGEI